MSFSSSLLRRPLRAGLRLCLLAALAISVGCASQPRGDAPSRDNAAVTAEIFAALRDHPTELRMFLQAMPKGGDLHNHLSGAVYAESYLDWAVEDGLCLDLEASRLLAPPCEEAPTLAAALEEGQVTRDALVDAWSLRNFTAGFGAASGHEQFFRTFDLFGAISGARQGEMLAEVVRRNADQRVLHLELIRSFAAYEARSLARSLDLQRADAEAEAALLEAGLEDLVDVAQRQVDAMETEAEAILGCDLGLDDECPVSIRYVAQVLRTVPPAEVLAQSLVAFALAERDPRVVAVNLVAPEDHHLVLSTYREQMGIIGRLAARHPEVGVTLHAGELTLGLVPPADLRGHIREAVEIAGAKRIGHGVAIAYEEEPERLLRALADDRIAVEINLTSNDVILGVEGPAHPFPTYRRYGVPLVISTDDEGVARNDLTHEYQRVVEAFGLDYAAVKDLSRRSLEVSFLPGESLWGESLWRDFDSATPVAPCREWSAACEVFLRENEKARRQWALEEAFLAFEGERAALLREGVMPPLSAY